MIDKLEHMIKMQLEMQERTYGFDFVSMSQDERIRYIRDQHQAVVVELTEVLDETEWKPWAKPSSPVHGRRINRDEYVSELIDVIHFWLNMLFPVCGKMTPTEIADEIFTRFALKNRTNAQRQLDGYDGKSTKCGGCSRALDDVAVECTRTGDQGYCAKTDADVNYIGVDIGAPISVSVREKITSIKLELCFHCQNHLAYYGCYNSTPERWGWCGQDERSLPPIKIPTS